MSTDERQGTVVPVVTTKGLPDLPAEIIVDIIVEAGVQSPREYVQDYPTHAIELVRSCKKLYEIFKENELVIARRTLTQIMPPEGEDFVEMFVKIGLSRALKPWPVEPDEIRQILLNCLNKTYIRPVLPVPSGTYVNIIGYFRQQQEVSGSGYVFVNDCCWVPSWLPLYDEPHVALTWQNQRREWSLAVREVLDTEPIDWIRFTNVKDWEESPDVRLHPFDLINPMWMVPSCRVSLQGRGWSVQEVVSEAMQKYELHAQAPVNTEDQFFGTEGYIPCCLLENCPRFTKVGTEAQHAAVTATVRAIRSIKLADNPRRRESWPIME